MFRVTGIGVPTIDRIVHVPELPGWGSGMVVEMAPLSGGGPVATALVTAARQGVVSSLIARTGDDEAGHWIADDLAAEGVDTQFLSREGDTRSATSVILVDPDGERSILYDPGANNDPDLDNVALDHIAASDGLLLERCTEASLAGARHAQRHGTVVLLDAGGWDERVMELVPSCAIVIGSAYHAESRGLSPADAVEELLAQGVHVAVITGGGAGSIGRTTDGQVVTMPAYPVQVVDSTGAGDVYHGAFMVEWLRSGDLERSMRFASVVAAIKCTCVGGRAGIPDAESVDAVLRAW